MANEKVSHAETRVDPYARMEHALALFQTAATELPPEAYYRKQGDEQRPMPAIMARLIAATYRQMAEDMDSYASNQSRRELKE